MKPVSIYIHVPFCKQKCFYCDFNSFSGCESQMNAYINSLVKEIYLYRDKLSSYRVQTVFIGGGTPSLLDNNDMKKIVSSIREYCTLDKDAEISIEVNPGTVNKEKLQLYYELGINRLSIGLQSCHNKSLKFLGRIHTYEEYLKNLMEAREVGFTNINTDLIFALPGQTIEEWKYCISELIKLKVPHISTYSLIIEEGTPFFTLLEEKKIEPLDEDTDLNMYKEGIRLLEEHGYKHYEISNFSLPTYKCRHNINYWLNGEYFGFGAGSHSNINKSRYSNFSALKEYIEMLNENKFPVEDIIHSTTEDEISETMFLGLRLIDGVSIVEFKKRFGKTPIQIYGEIIRRLEERNLIECSSERIKLTKSGLYLSNIVFQELLLD